MSEIKVTDLYVFQHQDPVDSYPLRTNFANVKAAHNDERNRVTALLALDESGPEVVDSRDYADVLRDRIHGVTRGCKNQVISGFNIYANAPVADMTVRVSSGDAIINGVYIRLGLERAWTQDTTGTITIVEPAHGLEVGDTIYIESGTGNIDTGDVLVDSVVDANTFTFISSETPDASGTLSFSRYIPEIDVPVASTSVPVPTRLDCVAINSDNTISVVTGAADTDPVFPAIATSQIMLAVLVVRADTTDFTKNRSFYEIQNDPDFKLPDVFIGTEQTFYPGAVVCNNLIIESAPVFTPGIAEGAFKTAQNKYYLFRCKGKFITTANLTMGNLIVAHYDAESGGDCIGAVPDGGDGGAYGLRDGFMADWSNGRGGFGGEGLGGGGGASSAAGGGGGGGGGSVVASGGDGGDGGNGGMSSGTVVRTDNQSYAKSSIVVIANDIYVSANITANGTNGSNGTPSKGALTNYDYGSGGNGGAAGGNIVLIAKNSLSIPSGTMSVNGGNGGTGGLATSGSTENAGGGGGGGGAGGLILGRGKTVTNAGTQSSVGGSYGNGGVASGGSITNPGADGTSGNNGVVDIQEYDDLWTGGLDSGMFPMNNLPFGFLD